VSYKGALFYSLVDFTDASDCITDASLWCKKEWDDKI